MLANFDVRNVHDLDSIKLSAFKEPSKKLSRSVGSCHRRWTVRLVPILKAHLLGIPYNFTWKKDLMEYIVDNAIDEIGEIDLHQLVKDIFPGQTRQSLHSYIFNNTYIRVEGSLARKHHSKEPLHEQFHRKLIEPPIYNISNAHQMKDEENVQRAADIIKIYDSLNGA